MDFHRANRNLRLVKSGISDENNLGSFNLDETQVPISSGFSSDSDHEEQEKIFINTQVQGRLDEAEETDGVRASLGKFRYGSPDKNKVSPKRSSTLQRPSARPAKRSNESQRSRALPTKAQSLLKQLSGKHAKVEDMIKYQQKLDSVRSSQQKAKNKGKTAKTTKKRKEEKYDTYNANEWQSIYNLLLEKFPQTRPSELQDVYQYLYGDEGEDQPLWNESQKPIESESQNLESLPPPVESHRVSVLSLSQVMNDNHSVESEEDIIVPDSTDEEYMVIPVPSSSPQELSRPPRLPLVANPPLLAKPETPKTVHSPSDGVIDLTGGSFKAVKSLISPLKEEIAQVQVPATRTPTLGTAPNLLPAKEQPLRYRLHKTQLDSFSTIEGLIIHSPGQSQDELPVPDTESEDSTSQDHYTVELEPSKLTSKTPSPSAAQPDWGSQSAQQLRHSMKLLGLKTSRSKQQMLFSLQQASQVLEIDHSTQDNHYNQENQRQDIHKYLTSLVQSSPALLEKVYTFQPIASKELLSRLTEANPFVDAIDEYTIREWADSQGICLTTG